MSHIPSHFKSVDEDHQTFLAILKIPGDLIHLWHHERLQSIGKTHTFRVSCHHVENHSDNTDSSIKVLTLNSEPKLISGGCKFQPQQLGGKPTAATDTAIFMTEPVPSSRRASYAIDLGISRNLDINGEENECEKMGMAYIYLDPRFSTQGTQLTPIVAQNHTPIGQIQVDYLIVTNPIAYGQPKPKPNWLFKAASLDCGHRGTGMGVRTDLPEKFLENTIASFNYAHRNGADMCELDAVVSADGVPVVYHDFDIDANVAAQHTGGGELGKFRIQVNEFTVKQLRGFKELSMNDEQHVFTFKVDNLEDSYRPFPTLAEVLDRVDETCGLNIEIKWPQQLVSGKYEARKYMEINDFVDKIINVVTLHGRDRRIVLESFDADLVILLRLKQTRFPVVFLSICSTTRYENYSDIRTKSIINGVYFGQAFDLAGIDLILEYYITSGKKLVDFIRDHGLVPRAWGDLGEDSVGTLKFLKDIGLQCVTYDKVDLLKQQISEKEDKKQRSISQSSIQQEQESDCLRSRVVREIC